MPDFISPLIAVIVTLLVVFTIFGLLANYWWNRFKKWFAGFKDIHLSRSFIDKEVKLEATVTDQDWKAPPPPPPEKKDVRVP